MEKNESSVNRWQLKDKVTKSPDVLEKEVAPTALSISGMEKIVIALISMKDKYPTINGLVESNFITPADVYTSQSISKLAETLNSNPALFTECLNMLDVIEFYSQIYTGNGDAFIISIVNMISSNRTLTDSPKTTYPDMVNDYIFDNKERLSEFIMNNKHLLPIYIASMLAFITEE